ncbi:Os06g0587500 [Oryza sativa Japonica Group]|uniref:Os06g0587500 protein n=1 Tax=Oryza sativa subsp. japonica TaxID=39947 RepID=A0A0P0WYB1_ORYSJ|nr:Os06g0587500 [Oryza sativa Japonica Group]
MQRRAAGVDACADGSAGRGLDDEQADGQAVDARCRFACLRNAPRNPPRNARLSSRRIASGVRSFGGTVPSCLVCLRPPPLS